MIWEGIHAQSPIGIVIAARELGKSDFLSVGHDFSMRKNVGKKWVFCGAMEEEEGGEKLVESYLRQEEEDESRDGGFVRIEEELKAGEVGKPPSFIDKFLNNKDFNVMDQPDDLTLRYDRYWYSAPIDVQRADRYNESIGRYDRYSPTVTQGVVAGLRPN
ncbi:hypothetical protein L249_7458 [Ophiocordyceps polyrhachis-furcata BCC 54312]|uniref:Uncharacterized protein n=1 Tax=Ophiocordyceps polyrhachis-furcata BCC 54312 TaxID=1330021 RepID=A0A367LBQ8_9HYPO|nr:hypothetical protein L249_7458 [Ophiocordyceps polyrhachis-furcata BCC 54312]